MLLHFKSARALETLVLVMIFLQALKSHVAPRVLDIWEQGVGVGGRKGGKERVRLDPKITGSMPRSPPYLFAVFSLWANHQDIVSYFTEAASVDRGTCRVPRKTNFRTSQALCAACGPWGGRGACWSMRITKPRCAPRRRQAEAGSATATGSDWLLRRGGRSRFRRAPEVALRPCSVGHGESGAVASEL